MYTAIHRVVLLISDQPAARAIAHAIAERGIIVGGIIIQSRQAEAKSWKHVVRWILGKDLYLRLVALRWPSHLRDVVFAERRMERQARDMLARFLGRQPRAFPETQMLRTEDVNSDRAYRFLQEQAPDLLVVYGTGLLRKRTMEVARLGAVNAHTALLPDYRGAGAEFWQIYDKAYDKTGISIHFIDDGVDTGDIVYRRHVPVSDTTDPSMLRALNTIQIVQHYPRVVEEVLSGTAPRYPQGPSSTRCFRTKDLTQEHKRTLFQRLKVSVG